MPHRQLLEACPAQLPPEEGSTEEKHEEERFEPEEVQEQVAEPPKIQHLAVIFFSLGEESGGSLVIVELSPDAPRLPKDNTTVRSLCLLTTNKLQLTVLLFVPCWRYSWLHCRTINGLLRMFTWATVL